MYIYILPKYIYTYMYVEICIQYFILDYKIWYINIYMLIILSEKEVF